MNLYVIYRNNLSISFDDINKDIELSQHIQIVLVAHKLPKPPADGIFGPISLLALKAFATQVTCTSTVLDASLAELLIETKPQISTEISQLNTPETSKTQLYSSASPVDVIINYCIKQDFLLYTGKGEVNIIYLEGCNLDFSLNKDAPNIFNDVRLIIQFIDKKPVITFKCKATTEPGDYYTINPMNKNGAARICMGQHLNAWSVGIHLAGKSTAHEALCQVAPVVFVRDRNKDYMRTGDIQYRDIIGLNHHGSWGHNGNVGRWSAGCLVADNMTNHREFMRICKTDPRYVNNNRFRFSAIVLDASKVFQ